uniref:Uncharacterized protein n=1 Tax=Meloidogyne enterolobii TaxID=390850 RepID=A0A6V7W7A1_MELEN|nr:unnamed protein product [Meloidogyne enterolobii]
MLSRPEPHPKQFENPIPLHTSDVRDSRSRYLSREICRVFWALGLPQLRVG